MSRLASKRPCSVNGFLLRRRNSAQIEYRNGVETVLDICEFHARLSKSDWLIALTQLLDEAGSMNDPTTDALLFHCRTQWEALRRARVYERRASTIAKIDDAPLVPITTNSFDDAADALFLIIRNTPVMPAPTFRAQGEMVISDV